MRMSSADSVVPVPARFVDGSVGEGVEAGVGAPVGEGEEGAATTWIWRYQSNPCWGRIESL